MKRRSFLAALGAVLVAPASVFAENTIKVVEPTDAQLLAELLEQTRINITNASVKRLTEVVDGLKVGRGMTRCIVHVDELGFIPTASWPAESLQTLKLGQPNGMVIHDENVLMHPVVRDAAKRLTNSKQKVHYG